VTPTTTDVHVLHNSGTLFDGAVTAFGAGPRFDSTVVVAAGDTIDFAVGYGSNHTFDCDSTGLGAVISYNTSNQVITDYTFTLADTGRHTFSATLKTAGGESLTVTDTANSAIAATRSITITPAAPSRLLLSAPASVKAGVKFSLTVSVVDAYGNVVTGYRGKISFRSSDSSASLPGNYTFTAADAGVHIFTGLVLRKKGKQTIAVKDTQNSSITGSLDIQVL
jgi:hypothetical protein